MNKAPQVTSNQSQPFVVYQVSDFYPHAGVPADAVIAQLFDKLGSTLLVSYSNLQIEEVMAVRTGQIEVSMITENNCILLFWKVKREGETVMTFATPFDIRHYVQTEYEIPTLHSDKTRILLSIHLIESRTYLMAGIRNITLSPEFSRMIVDAVNAQLKSGQAPNNSVYDRWESMPMDELSILFSDFHPLGETN